MWPYNLMALIQTMADCVLPIFTYPRRNMGTLQSTLGFRTNNSSIHPNNFSLFKFRIPSINMFHQLDLDKLSIRNGGPFQDSNRYQCTIPNTFNFLFLNVWMLLTQTKASPTFNSPHGRQGREVAGKK
ncbi:hypothetical protein Patl1_28016 [Pistacia atlantica]|uniref:Uncharacterized protein n=1 Tax=Pistacia atlantica TaxID=434234 RepID=A0ACC1BDS8_9ROSI|nr:hypothetical protein Patl1_28016 [Pistacia atlantica]